MSLLSDLGTKIGTLLKGKLDVDAKAADTDLFDGKDSTVFIFGNTVGTNQVTDFNALTKSGFYDGNPADTAGNAFGTTGTWNWLVHHEHSNANGYGFQQAILNSGTVRMKLRTQSGNSWNSWTEVITTNNVNDYVSAGSGKVLQVAEYIVPSTNDTYVAIGSGVQWDTPITISFTPKSSTSKIYIDVDCQFRINGAYGMSVGVKRDGVKIPGNFNRSAQMFIYKGETLNHHYNPRVSASVTSNNTNATTFTVWYEPYNGTGEFNYGWGRNAIRVMEVEA